jgi:hypothetical protein
MQKLIKQLLNNISYSWIHENKTAFGYFKKSDYWKNLKDDIRKHKNNLQELEECVAHYANLFEENTRFLNLF